jgi:hypothetical protein
MDTPYVSAGEEMASAQASGIFGPVARTCRPS